MKILKKTDLPAYCQSPQKSLTVCFVLVEGFLAVFSDKSRFSKSILPLAKQKYAILVSLTTFKAVKEPIHSYIHYSGTSL